MQRWLQKHTLITALRTWKATISTSTVKLSSLYVWSRMKYGLFDPATLSCRLLQLYFPIVLYFVYLAVGLLSWVSSYNRVQAPRSAELFPSSLRPSLAAFCGSRAAHHGLSARFGVTATAQRPADGSRLPVSLRVSLTPPDREFMRQRNPRHATPISPNVSGLIGVIKWSKRVSLECRRAAAGGVTAGWHQRSPLLQLGHSGAGDNLWVKYSLRQPR